MVHWNRHEWELKVKPSKLCMAQVNAAEEVTICLRFKSDCFRVVWFLEKSHCEVKRNREHQILLPKLNWKLLCLVSWELSIFTGTLYELYCFLVENRNGQKTSHIATAKRPPISDPPPPLTRVRPFSFVSGSRSLERLDTKLAEKQ